MWRSIGLREVRAFLVLADELHFGRAADRLGVSQSRVSQLIRELEARIGASLFHRTSRRVRLTAAGQRLVDDLAPAVRQLDDVLERAYELHHVVTGTVNLGLLSRTSGGSSLLQIIDAFETQFPRCHVQVSEMPLGDTLEPLRSGAVDIMASLLPIDQPDLVIGTILASEPRVLAVARDHPLAGRAEVSLEDVADYNVMRLDAFPPETVEALIPARAPSGRPIVRMSEPSRSVAEVVTLIARGVIVHPTIPPFGVHLGHPNIVLVPLSGMPRLQAGLVWVRDSADHRIREFNRVAREVMGGGVRRRSLAISP